LFANKTATLSPFGDVIFIESNVNAPNLLSLAQCMTACDLFVDNEVKSLILKLKTDYSLSIEFNLDQNGLFVNRNFISEIEKFRTNVTAFVGVVSDSTSNHSLSEKVHAVHHWFSHPSYSTMRKIVEAKCYDGLNLTINDINKCRHIIDNCLECQLGKITRSNPSMSNEKKAKVVAERLHIDLATFPFYKDKEKVTFTYLISVDEFSGFVIGIQLLSLNTKSIISALEKIINIYKSYKHDIKLVKSDRGTSFISSQSYLQSKGIQSEFTGAEDHDPFVERCI